MPKAGEDQLAQLQRPGLALDHGSVVIAYGQNTGDCPGPNGPAHGFVVSIPEQGGHLHDFQIGHGRDRGAVWMGGSSPVIDPHGNVYVASADGYDLAAGQPYDDSDAVLKLSPTMHLERLSAAAAISRRADGEGPRARCATAIPTARARNRSSRSA